MKSANCGDHLPPSATLSSINLAGLLAFLFALHHVCVTSAYPVSVKAAIVVLAASAPVFLLEVLFLKVHRRDSTGLQWDAPCRFDPGRSLTKLLGLTATLAGIGLCYWAFPEYHGNFYDPFRDFLARFGGCGLLLAVPYFLIVDMKMREPRDGYWHLGRLLLGKGDFQRSVILDHLRGWAIKAFFLPLMFVYLCQNIGGMSRFQDLLQAGSFIHWNDFFCHMAFTTDLVFATAGYLLSLRVIDSHIRSADPTMTGWLVALVCYQPFFSLMSGQYLHYQERSSWVSLLQGWPALQLVWGCAIIALLLVYAWTTVTFGCRFSNLTHRGILTGGPYRFTKHPAYLSKNLSWWLISMPFLSAQGWQSALRHSLLLLCLNGIYWMRARTEERHLSADPTYVAYALWINKHGLFSRIAGVLPALRYRPPDPATPDEIPEMSS